MTRQTTPSLGLLLSFGAIVTTPGCKSSETNDTNATSAAEAGTTEAGTAGTAGGPPACGATVDELIACVSQDRYVQDVTFIAQPRPPGSPHHQAVADLCFNTLSGLGYEVERVEFATGTNVVGRKLGRTLPDEVVVFGAHYDSINEPGVSDACPGADDNASGTAGILETARVLAAAEFDRTVVFGCWDDEENHADGAELGGSTAFVAAAVADGQNIIGHYDYEMIGFRSSEPDTQRVPEGFDAVFPDQVAALTANEFRGDFITIVADEHAHDMADALVRHAEPLGLPTMWLELETAWTTSPLFSDLRRSDHAAFWDAGIPAIMITDSSEFRYKPYHCRDGIDELSLLDHEFSTQVIQISVGSAAELLGL
ncbi:MAG: M28 family peptidase [Myxococcota bacterium]